MEVVLIFIIGLAFGSFLNVVIYRLKSGDPLGFSRSFCPDCQIQLKWHDLIPVLSFVWLRGFCRYCHKKISWQYPIVEIFSGLIWVLVFYKVFGFQPSLVPPLIKGGLGGFLIVPFLDFFYYIFILSSFLIIAVYDAKHWIIPDKIVYPAIIVALIYNLFNAIKEGLGGVLLTASGAFLFFFFIFYLSKGRAMGLGDAKLSFLIGLFLGFPAAIFAFFLAFTVGAVYGIILLISGAKSLKSAIAFGPFLVFGAIISFFLADLIKSFYFNF